MDDPRLAQMPGNLRFGRATRFFLKGTYPICPICMRPVAQIAERNRYAAPVLLVHLSASCSV